MKYFLLPILASLNILSASNIETPPFVNFGREAITPIYAEEGELYYLSPYAELKTTDQLEITPELLKLAEINAKALSKSADNENIVKSNTATVINNKIRPSKNSKDKMMSFDQRTAIISGENSRSIDDRMILIKPNNLEKEPSFIEITYSVYRKNVEVIGRSPYSIYSFSYIDPEFGEKNQLSQFFINQGPFMPSEGIWSKEKYYGLSTSETINEGITIKSAQYKGATIVSDISYEILPQRGEYILYTLKDLQNYNLFQRNTRRTTRVSENSATIVSLENDDHIIELPGATPPWYNVSVNITYKSLNGKDQDILEFMELQPHEEFQVSKTEMDSEGFTSISYTYNDKKRPERYDNMINIKLEPREEIEFREFTVTVKNLRKQ
jgi:hypothetical protein